MLSTFIKVARPLVFLSALALRSSRSQRIVLGILVLSMDALVFRFTLQEIGRTHPFSLYGTLTTILLQSLDVWDLLLLAKDPQSTIKKRGQDHQTSSLPVISRYKWAAAVLFSPRKLGTTYEIPNVPPYNGPSGRGDFILRGLARMAIHTLRLGFLYLVLAPRKYYFQILLNQPPAHSVAMLIVRRCAAASSILITAYVVIDIAYLTGAIILVALRITEPREWPEIFGDFTKAMTIRKCWGQIWHQYYRRAFTVIPDYFVNTILGIRKGSHLSSYMKLFMGFGLSAWGHSGGDYALSLGRRYTSPRFFLLQPCAILVEDHAISIAKRLGGNDIGERFPTAVRIVGYSWVTFVFAMTLPEFGTLHMTAYAGLDPNITY